MHFLSIVRRTQRTAFVIPHIGDVKVLFALRAVLLVIYTTGFVICDIKKATSQTAF